MVLGSTKGVSDTFDAIDDGAGHIVSRIELVLATSAVMSLIHAAVQDGITQSAVLGFHVNLGTQAVSLALISQRKTGQSLSGEKQDRLVKTQLNCKD